MFMIPVQRTLPHYRHQLRQFEMFFPCVGKHLALRVLKGAIRSTAKRREPGFEAAPQQAFSRAKNATLYKVALLANMRKDSFYPIIDPVSYLFNF
jgi:hypothetical protein